MSIRKRPWIPAWVKWSLPAVVPPLLLLYFVRALGVNVVRYDDWELVPLIQKLESRTLTFSDLFNQHNEHRILFAKVVMLGIESVSRFNTVVLMFVSWGLICFSALLILLVFRREFPLTTNPRLALAFVPVSLMLFSICQYESILWGFELSTYLMCFCVVATFYLNRASRGIDVKFMLATIGATIASFSGLVVGLLIWPAATLQILILKKERYLPKLAIFISTCLFEFVSYFSFGYRLTPAEGSIGSLAAPFTKVMYFLTLIGAPLSASTCFAGSTPSGWILLCFPPGYTIVASVLGLVIVLISLGLLFQVSIKRRLLHEDNSVWFSLLLFTGLASLGNAAGRAFALSNALDSRYTPVTILGIVGLYLLALSLSKYRISNKILTRFLVILILLGLIISSPSSLQAAQVFGQRQEMSAYVLKTYAIQSDANIVEYLYPPSARITRERASFLQQRGWNVFSETPINTSTLVLIRSTTDSKIEAVDDVMVTWNGNGTRSAPIVIDSNQTQTVTITGWAVDTKAGDVASAVFITLDGRTEIPSLYGVDRPDVSNELGNSKFRFSGFIASFSSTILSKGNHTIALVIVGKTGYYYFYSAQTVYLVVV